MTDNTPTVPPLPPLDEKQRADLRGWAKENMRRGWPRERFLSNEDTLALLDQVDALLARVLTPEEARRAAHTVAVAETWGPQDGALEAKLGQIAGDR